MKVSQQIIHNESNPFTTNFREPYKLAGLTLMTLFDLFCNENPTQIKNEGGKVCVERPLSKAVDVKGLTDGGQSGDRQAVYTGSSPRDVCTCTCTPLLFEVGLKAIEV